jgi:hypothetical protein
MVFREDMTVANKKPPQHETDARILREKTARLRELRLARDGANGGAAPIAKRPALKSKPRPEPGKRPAQGVSLSQWLSSQDKEGRRN